MIPNHSTAFSKSFYSSVIRRPKLGDLVSYDVESDTIGLLKSYSVKMQSMSCMSLNDIFTFSETQCEYAFKYFVNVP